MSEQTISDDNAVSVVDAAEETTVFTITDSALAMVNDIRSAEPDADDLALRVAVTGFRGTEFTYDLSLAKPEEILEDTTFTVDGLMVAVPTGSVAQLQGAVLDVSAAGPSGGLVIRNPNQPNPYLGVELNRDGAIADQVRELFEKAVNPSLASHGGYAELVGVDEDDKVYLRMGGGCQGCAMSRMTLTQGIETAIHDAIPEVVAVIDVTDHTSGDNPFYT